MKHFLTYISTVFFLFQRGYSHYVWLTTDDIQSTKSQPQNTTLQLSEFAGVPGPEVFIAPLIDLTIIHMQSVSLPKTKELPFKLDGTRTSAQFVAPLELENYSSQSTSYVYIIEAFVDYGMFGDGLLQYYANNVKVNENTDWPSIENLASNLFEITLRDPFISKSERLGAGGEDVFKSLVGNSGDQCKLDRLFTENGEACVLAVVRFKGQILQSAMNVTTYDGDTGLVYKTAECDAGGIVTLAVPINSDGTHKRVYAKVQYKEFVAAQEYEYIDHWASTMGEFER